jgi:hypothetical protein
MSTYTTNPQVIHETIDGETIIIDLVSGTYYSLQGSGPQIWNRLSAGESRDSSEVEGAVAAFLGDLERERLVAVAEGENSGEARARDDGGDEPAAPFTLPKLEKYTDMQDIILLDPVHQVDSRGWPHAVQDS